MSVPQSTVHQLDLFLRDVWKPSTVWKPNVNFGVTFSFLNALQTEELALVYRGIHNLDVPLEMYASANPDEIISYYIGSCVLKADNHHYIGPKLSFLQIIQRINEVTYRNPNRSLLNLIKFGVGWSGKPVSIGRPFKGKTEYLRLGSLDDQVKQAFVKSFYEKYAYSMRERTDEFDYGGLNADANNRRIYIEAIHDRIRTDYKRYMSIR